MGAEALWEVGGQGQIDDELRKLMLDKSSAVPGDADSRLRRDQAKGQHSKAAKTCSPNSQFGLRQALEFRDCAIP